jgi:branched-chain amino acid transport system permease protein
MAVKENTDAAQVATRRSIWTFLNQIFGPLLQMLLYTMISAVSLGTIVIVLALLLDSTRETNMLQSTVIILPQVIIDGLSRGFLYAMIALGYTMVYGVLEFINFAHGEIFMVGAFTVAAFGAVLASQNMVAGFPVLLYVLVAVLLGMIISGGLAVLTERVAYRHLRNSPRLVLLVSTIGMSLFLQDFVRLIATTVPFGGDTLGFNATVQTPALGASFCVADIGQERLLDRNTGELLCSLHVPLVEGSAGAFIDNRSLIFIIASILMLIGLNYLVNVTKVGKAMRAVAQDRATASLMGINVNSIIALTFLVGGALGGAAGALFAIRVQAINPYVGFLPGLKAFTAAVLGGIGNITGAMVGGIVLGFLEAFVASYLSLFTQGQFAGANYADIAAFSILIIILIFRPEGLLGEATTQKV